MSRPQIQEADIELLFKALKAYEEQPSTTGLTMSIMMTMAGLNGRTEEDRKASVTADMAQANREVRKREEECIMLKAKLLQLKNWVAEHEMEEHAKD